MAKLFKSLFFIFLMCSRMSMIFDSTEVSSIPEFKIDKVKDSFAPNYNIAPTQDSPVVTVGSRILEVYKFGLIPKWWSKDKPTSGFTNAKAETIMEKASFKEPLKNKRCLVLASSFFEWTKNKRPYIFIVKDKKVFAMAGIWDEWTNHEGKKVRSFAIITTTPNNTVKKVHHRMPVILDPKDYDAYLTSKDLSEVIGLLKPYNAKSMEGIEVSQKANNSRNNSPEVLEPVK
jgi:putative SOS response-associated peptidase YedK